MLKKYCFQTFWYEIFCSLLAKLQGNAHTFNTFMIWILPGFRNIYTLRLPCQLTFNFQFENLSIFFVLLSVLSIFIFWKSIIVLLGFLSDSILFLAVLTSYMIITKNGKKMIQNILKLRVNHSKMPFHIS